MKSLSVLVTLFLIQICLCYTNFTGIEICALYRNYTSNKGNYGQMGEPSTENYPGGRMGMLGTYNKKTNILWIFGGNGYGESEGGMK